MAGTLNIQLVSQPADGYRITIVLRYLSNNGSYNTVSLPFEFLNRRVQPGQVTIAPTLDRTALNFISAINSDYRNTGGSNNISAQGGQESLVVNLANASWEFVSIEGDTQFLDYTIESGQTEIPKTAEFIGYDASNSSCDTVVALFKLTGGTESYNVYLGGAKVVENASSPVSVPLQRATDNLLKFTDSNNTDIAVRSLKTPRKMIPADISFFIDYADNGASINVQAKGVSTYLKPLTFSLDGVSYSETNVFTGQPEGTHTVYVKDAFGCVTSKDVVVDGYSTVSQLILEVSDINPIRYALAEEGKKNRYNTLSHEQLKNIAYPFVQPFTLKDKPITQIKTNAKVLNTFALDCEGNKYPLSPVKRSDHLGQVLKTTAQKFATEDGRLGLYFGVADVLDPLTEEIIETKDYGYQVPYAFNKRGRFITIEGVGTIPVDAVEYDDSYEAFVLFFDVNYTGEETTVKVNATYNIQNYEVYEFVADMSALPEDFRVVIEAGVTEVERTLISEHIKRVEDSKNLIEIIYWNTTNLGGMNYGTGVVHTLRLYNVLSRLSDEQSVEGFNGNLERYNTDHEIFDGEEFIFGYLSEEMVRKLRLILTHDRLFINGVLFSLGDAPELNSRFTTNICELTAVLRTGGNMVGDLGYEVIEPVIGSGVDDATYELEQAIAAAKGKALILWKK